MYWWGSPGGLSLSPLQGTAFCLQSLRWGRSGSRGKKENKAAVNTVAPVPSGQQEASDGWKPSL